MTTTRRPKSSPARDTSCIKPIERGYGWYASIPSCKMPVSSSTTPFPGLLILKRLVGIHAGNDRRTGARRGTHVGKPIGCTDRLLLPPPQATESSAIPKKRPNWIREGLCMPLILARSTVSKGADQAQIFARSEPAGGVVLGYFTPLAAAFQTLTSSKKPSLPATPSSILDLVAWAMPEDFK